MLFHDSLLVIFSRIEMCKKLYKKQSTFGCQSEPLRTLQSLALLILEMFSCAVQRSSGQHPVCITQSARLWGSIPTGQFVC